MARCVACESGGGYHSRTCTSDTDCACGLTDCRDCMKRPGASRVYPTAQMNQVVYPS